MRASIIARLRNGHSVLSIIRELKVDWRTVKQIRDAMMGGSDTWATWNCGRTVLRLRNA